MCGLDVIDLQCLKSEYLFSINPRKYWVDFWRVYFFGVVANLENRT